MQDNIAAFGGDPDDVALDGQSAAPSALRSKLYRQAPQICSTRAILQSGILLKVTTLDEAEQLGTAFATAAGCPGTDSDTPAGLRALSVHDILDLQGMQSESGPCVTGLIVDGPSCPCSRRDLDYRQVQPDAHYAR